MHAAAAQPPDLQSGHEAQQVFQQQGPVNIPALLTRYNVKIHNTLERRAPYACGFYPLSSSEAIKDFSFKDFNAIYARYA